MQELTWQLLGEWISPGEAGGGDWFGQCPSHLPALALPHLRVWQVWLSGGGL